MNSNANKKGSDFKSPDDAFEYLLNQRSDEKRREAWKEALGPTPEIDDREVVKQRNLKRIYIRLASVAAAAIVIGGFFFLLQSHEPLDQYAGNMVEETKIVMSYGSESRGEIEMSDQAITSLKSELTSVLLDEDYNQALGYFKQLEKLTTLTTEDKYYYSVSLLKTKGEDNQKAIRLLNDVVSADNYLLEKALWLRGLAYGMTDNAILMKKDLNQLKTISKKEDKRVNEMLSKY